ncbi:centrosomal protein of 55 kDa [Coccinella septempunctata]|uniref:centrosomal protein of 55 kDa n=1 Tax=Coccinella septempunctata TaxID=41139 RepID=UPI001D06B357|nr:centrosomal protein of 55 kDa [Coccinella septempunctata]
MTPKLISENSTDPNISSINKQILEMKKKIQLSEGQRRALFEDCEAEKKSNAEEISKLKKENSDLLTSLYEHSNSTAKLEVQRRKIEHLIGPLEGKEGSEVRELLDLQLIDKSKQLDLLRYHMKKRRERLAQLGQKFQILMSEQAKKDTMLKVDLPMKKASCEIQNNIHAVEVQLREAEHIKNRYQVIKDTLSADAAKFESKIKKIEEDLAEQKNETDRLQKILKEAVTLKNNARRILLQEERDSFKIAKQREKQLEEGRLLVSARRTELESLEKKIYQTGKLTARPEPEGAEEATNLNDEDRSDSMLCPLEVLEKTFEKLKAATGAPTAEKTLEKFSNQRDTLKRLETLKAKAETEKEKLEKKVERRTAELEYLKYAQVKEADRNSDEVERKNNLLSQLQEKAKQCRESREQADSITKVATTSLHKIHMNLCRTATVPKDPLAILDHVKKEAKRLIDSYRKHTEAERLSTKEENVYQDEKWLPSPYIRLTSKTPVSQQGSPSVPPLGSDEEEEVPSRGHLKRQAQIVVDAKMRRKNIKMQLPRRI